MIRGLVGGVVVVAAAALLVPAQVAGAGAGSSAKVKDAKGDVKECDTGAPVDNTANDIRRVQARKDGSIKIRMRQSVESSLEDFSFAVVVTVTYPDGSKRAFLVEVHDGVERIGEIDPSTGELLPDGDGAVEIDGKSVEVDTGGSLPAGTTVKAEAFNIPAEGDPTSCDDASLRLDDR